MFSLGSLPTTRKHIGSYTGRMREKRSPQKKVCLQLNKYGQRGPNSRKIEKKLKNKIK